MKLLTYLFLFGFCTLAYSDNESVGLPSISFAPFPLKTVRTHIWSGIGTPVRKAEMNSPFPNDFPPFITAGLEDARSYPAFKKGPRYFFPAYNLLRVYQISDAQRVPYKTIQPQIAHLQSLLKTRPATVPSGQKHGNQYDRLEQLPDYPPRNAGHLIQIKMQYLDAAWGSGLFYISQFTQGTGSSLNNEELTYLFQGLSKDGKFYVSADFRITHPKLPRGIDKGYFGGESNAEIATVRAQECLLKQPDDTFSPSLQRLREWVSSMKIE